MDGMKYKVAFGAWINDMRNVPTPNQGWPYEVIDDQAVSDVIAALELQHQAGFNYVDICGLLVTFSWPLDIESAVSEERRGCVNRIIDAAHRLGMKITTFPGMFSWGFDEIIKQRPGVRGTSTAAMCASKEESWEWQFRVLDYTLQQFSKLDGIHIESGDRYRCTCELCEKIGHNKYLTDIDIRIADYIKENYPKKTVFVNTCGYRPWTSEEDTQCMIELSKHVDFIIAPNWWHEQNDLTGEDRRRFIASLSCDFGSSAGFWVYPPQRWNRLKWFLPYAKRTGTHIKQLYAEGGRAVEYYMGPIANPGVELNIAFGGRMLSQPEREIEDVLFDVVAELYKPRSDEACRALTRIFLQAEDAYFNNNRHRQGELRLTHLWGTKPGPECYISTYDEGIDWVIMDHEGRAGYKRELMAIQNTLVSLMEDRVLTGTKVSRIKTCIDFVIRDLDKIGYNKPQEKKS
jgi:hypothetical protein